MEEAGQRYLAAVCPSNAALDAYRRVWDRFDNPNSPDDAPHPRTKEAARKKLDADTEAAQALADPDYVWPASVREDVVAVATELFEGAVVYKEIVEASAWSDVRAFPEGGDAASTVRVALGLPLRGECPDEYLP